MGYKHTKVPRYGISFEELKQVVNKVGQASEENASQLDNIVNEKTIKTTNKRKAFVTIIDDDGRSEFISNGFSAVIANHPSAKIGLAINPDKIGTSTYLTWSDIDTFKSNTQYEILNHGWSHAEPLNLTLEQIKANYELEKSKFIEHGLLEYDYYVYAGYTPPPTVPNQIENADLKNKLRQIYKCSLNNNESKIANIPFDAYDVRRVWWNNSLDSIKSYIDDCISNGSWCVIFGHSWMSGQSDSSLLENILTYLDSKISAGKIEFKTVKEIVDNYSNIFELGGGVAGADYFRLDKNGNVNFSINNKSVIDLFKFINFPYANFSDIPITEYPKQSITFETITYSLAISIGLPEAGMVMTVRNYTSGNEYFTYQQYQRYDSCDIFERKWLYNLSRWTPFYPLQSSGVTSPNRPRYAPRGVCILDVTLGKPVWSHGGYTANKTLLRSTAYKKWDIVNESGSDMFLCIVEGTTSSSVVTLDKSVQYNNTVDGTVTWQYLGSTKATWKDATGTAV